MAELTYKQLQRTVDALARDVMQHSGAVQQDAQALDREAKDTARTGEVIAAIGVDPATVADAQQLATITASPPAGHTPSPPAPAAGAPARASHGGNHEAYTRATVDISRMKPEWLRQE